MANSTLDRQALCAPPEGIGDSICAEEVVSMRTFNIVVERDPDTGLYVGHVPGWPGAHSQGASLDELRHNLHEVVEMLLEDGEPKLESEFVGIQTIQVA